MELREEYTTLNIAIEAKHIGENADKRTKVSREDTPKHEDEHQQNGRECAKQQ